jgi:hypothetical protein
MVLDMELKPVPSISTLEPITPDVGESALRDTDEIVGGEISTGVVAVEVTVYTSVLLVPLLFTTTTLYVPSATVGIVKLSISLLQLVAPTVQASATIGMSCATTPPSNRTVLFVGVKPVPSIFSVAPDAPEVGKRKESETEPFGTGRTVIGVGAVAVEVTVYTSALLVPLLFSTVIS